MTFSAESYTPLGSAASTIDIMADRMKSLQVSYALIIGIYRYLHFVINVMCNVRTNWPQGAVEIIQLLVSTQWLKKGRRQVFVKAS